MARRTPSCAACACAARRAAQRLVEHVSAGIALSAERASGEVLYDYLRRSGMLGRLARFADDGPDVAGLRGVVRFFELVRDRASLLALDRLPFLVPHLVTPVDVAEDMQTGPDDQRVAVLTVHRAKGLEFRHVIVAGLVDGRFPVRGRPPALALPPELAGGPGGDPDEEHMAEERRLFYVAMTRARDELWLSYHTAGPNGRGRRRPSPFIAEALDLPVAPPPAGSAVTATPLEDVSRIVRCAPDPAVEEPVRSAPGGPLSLSFSQVDDYLSCPERYRLRHVVGLPTPAHHALSYGGAMHQAVAAFHLRAGQGKTMTETELLAELNRHWTPQGFLSREHEEARHAAGRVALRRFRQQQLTAPASVVAVERPFRFRLGDDQIVGRVDRVDQLPDGGTVITDYKTSDVREQRRADARARDSLQLHVYALAQQAETGVPPAAVQLHFLDSGVVGRAVPDEARLEKARQKLTAVADGIRAGEFAPKPNAVACGYCPFRQICPSSAA
ncbi:MAG TPA: PD-(D/E)XK nuclease family protein [Candidatus Limnocylindria bacterium]|nr:PD-(D/E)XK nuclease family protein [Candidatus Limnocylindria bacterium]